MRHIIPISGKDSLATAIVQRKRMPELDYEYVFNPTGAELPDVFEWLVKCSAAFGKPIHHIGNNLYEIIEDRNFFLPSRRARYCTEESKIRPFEKWIGKEDCTVYYGIRSDENRGGYSNSKYPNIVPNYPLKEENIGIEGVYSIINSYGLKPPTFFWKSVYLDVCKTVGLDTVKMLLADWQVDMFFSWRTRANCYYCFNQRKYEWVGLLEHYPDLFWKAESMEHSGSEYYWNGKDYPLTKIVENSEKIKQKRVSQLSDYILKMKQLTLNFTDLQKENQVLDFFSTTSCGLFCGK